MRSMNVHSNRKKKLSIMKEIRSYKKMMCCHQLDDYPARSTPCKFNFGYGISTYDDLYEVTSQEQESRK